MMELIHMNKGTSYSELLNKLKAFANPILLRQQAGQFVSNPFKYFAIRHDVDEGTLAPTLAFARFERQHGIRATYFLHQNRAYWDWSSDQDFIGHCHDLRSMGHEIGWHNDALARWLEEGQTKQLPHYILTPLDYLRGHGIQVRGTSCHGSKITNDLGVKNYDIWLDNPYPVSNEDAITHRAMLSTYDLDYEAYFLQRDVYLSDNHGIWTGAIKDEIDPFEGNPQVDPFALIETFKKLPFPGQSFLQILIHAQHWRQIR